MADKEEQNNQENNPEAEQDSPVEETAKTEEEQADPGRVVTPDDEQEVEEDLDDEPEGDELIKESKEIPKRDSDAPLTAADLKKQSTETQTPSRQQGQPVETEVKEHGKGKRWTMAAISLVIVMLVSAGAWLFFEYNSPERVFSDMLSNQLNTETVTYDAGAEYNTANFALTATVDATDQSNLKTTGAFDIALDFGFLGSFDVQYNVVTVDETLYMNFANFNVSSTVSDEQATEFDSPFESVKDSWVEVPISEAEELLNDRDFGAAEFSRGLLFGTGAVLTGNFTEDQRNTLLSLIESNDIYEITSSSEDIVNEANTYKYTVSLNEDNLKKLYAKANEFYGLNLEESDIEEYATGIKDDEVTLWVDRSTRRLARMELTEEGSITEEQTETATEDAVVVTIDFTEYNEPASIQAPADESIITVEEFEERVGPTF